MGLASKMAAAQQQQQQQQQQQFAPPAGPPPGYPQQPQQYAPPPGPPPSDAKQPLGPPSQQPYHHHQQPRQASSYDPREIERVLADAVQDQGIVAFYPHGSLGPIAQRVAASGALDQVARLYRLEKEAALNLAKLALFDTAILADDSGSMAFSKWQGERLDDLHLILSRVATTTALFDDDGISVRFLNSDRAGNGIRNEQDAMALLHGLEFKYQTPLGGALSKKILGPMLLQPAEQGRLQKPLLVILITDGAPTDGDLITRVIKDANARLKRTRYGADALSIQIAQVGSDLEAQEFLGALDEDRTVGDLIDCTSGFELESEEVRRKTGKEMTPNEWLLKLLLGAIDTAFDQSDESARSAGPGGGLFGGGGGGKKKGGLRGLFSRK